MAILAAELKLMKADVNNDTISNGGPMTNTEIVSGVKNALFPDVSQDERTAGMYPGGPNEPRYRLVWCKVANDADLELLNAVIHFKNHTPGGDFLELFDGDGIETQNDIVGSERRYGAGALRDSISSGGSQLVCTIEESGQIIFANTDKIYINDGTNEEYHSNVTISKSGSDVTIDLDAGDTFSNNFSNADSYVASVFEVSSVVGTNDPFTLGGGNTGTLTVDAVTYPIVVDNIAGIGDTWNFVFQSDGSFTCTGTRTGSIAAGDITLAYTPANATQSNKPYFTLPQGFFSGTPDNGDTATLVTYPAAHPVWLVEEVPAATPSQSGNGATLRFGGESA